MNLLNFTQQGLLRDGERIETMKSLQQEIPNNRVLRPKCHNLNGIWALKPYYLGPWTLRDKDLVFTLMKLRVWAKTCMAYKVYSTGTMKGFSFCRIMQEFCSSAV